MSPHAWLAAAVALTCTGAVLTAQTAQTAAPPDPNRRFLALKDFRLESGVVLPVANVAYATFGALNAAKDNAVLVPSYLMTSRRLAVTGAASPSVKVAFMTRMTVPATG